MMKRIYLGIILLTVGLALFAQPAGYYDDASGKSGDELRQALHDIIDGHTAKSYDYLWTAYRTTDKNDSGFVWDMYSDVPGGTPAYDYTFGSNQCGNYSGEGSCYNREHSFPKSWFGKASPMVTDLYHVVPTDGYVNGRRSNYPFGETNSPTWTSTNGCKLGPCSVSGYNGTIFEPIDAYKGDFARIYFYMATRYYGEDAGWAGSPMVNGSQLEPWAKDMLLQWHTNDPVSTKEINRNTTVYAIQNNRNPYVDHPEYVAALYGGSGGVVISDEMPPVVDSITVNSSVELLVWFNEPIDSESVMEVGHVKIGGGVSIETVSYDSEKFIASLGVSGLENGAYNMILNGVTDTAGNVMVFVIKPFQVSTLSVAQHLSRVDIKLYPNPTKGNFTVRCKDVDRLSVVKLYDLSGREVAMQTYFTNESIEVSPKASSGSYVLVLITDSGDKVSLPLLIE